MSPVTPDGGLWRGRADGTDKLQLSFPPLAAALPQWSPDGSDICFARGGSAGQPTRLLLVPAGGGTPREAVPGDEGVQQDGSWAPDGRRIAFGRGLPPDPKIRNLLTIQVANLATAQVTTLPGSNGLFSPRWSPDGRHLVALSHDSLRLLSRRFGQWAGHAPDDSILALRDTSLDEIFALELE